MLKTGTTSQLPPIFWKALGQFQELGIQIQAVIMFYQKLRREEFWQDNCHWGSDSREGRESVAASVGEIDGTDKRDRYQNHQGGQQG